jgi:hypothetical protein
MPGTGDCAVAQPTKLAATIPNSNALLVFAFTSSLPRCSLMLPLQAMDRKPATQGSRKSNSINWTFDRCKPIKTSSV